MHNGCEMNARKALWIGVILPFIAASPFAQSGAKAGAEQTAKASPEIEQGKKIFGERCAICHFSQSTEKKIGPGLRGIYGRGKFANSKKVDDASLRAWIETGGKDMPGFRDTLKNGDVRALLAYIKTL